MWELHTVQECDLHYVTFNFRMNYYELAWKISISSQYSRVIYMKLHFIFYTLYTGNTGEM
jgi:hypothetical protein